MHGSTVYLKATIYMTLQGQSLLTPLGQAVELTAPRHLCFLTVIMDEFGDLSGFTATMFCSH